MLKKCQPDLISAISSLLYKYVINVFQLRVHKLFLLFTEPEANILFRTVLLWNKTFWSGNGSSEIVIVRMDYFYSITMFYSWVNSPYFF